MSTVLVQGGAVEARCFQPLLVKSVLLETVTQCLWQHIVRQVDATLLCITWSRHPVLHSCSMWPRPGHAAHTCLP